MRKRIQLACIASILGTLGFVGCFTPNRSENLSCSPEGLCPDGLVCNIDNLCQGARIDGGTSSTLDATDSEIEGTDAMPSVDAMPLVDAMLVGCTNSSQCLSPPNLCFKNGDCNPLTNLCEYPEVTCQELGPCLDNQCNLSNGECESTDANELATCSPTTCEAFGACVFESPCSTSGIKARSCIDRVCSAGGCEEVPRTEEAPCIRATEGNLCGLTTCSPFSNCGGFSTINSCDETGVRARSCTDQVCAAGSCQPKNRVDTQNCTRNTDGDPCSSNIGLPSAQAAAQIIEGCCENASCSSTAPCAF